MAIENKLEIKKGSDSRIPSAHENYALLLEHAFVAEYFECEVIPSGQDLSTEAKDVVHVIDSFFEGDISKDPVLSRGYTAALFFSQSTYAAGEQTHKPQAYKAINSFGH